MHTPLVTHDIHSQSASVKVLQLIDSLEAGGAERVAVQFANAMVDTGSYLCATRAEGLLKASLHPQVGYLFLNKKSTLDLQAVLKLKRFVKHSGIQIIHAHSSSFFLATLVKLLYPKVHIIWHDHYGNSAYLNKRPKWILQVCTPFFSYVFCVNRDLENWARTVLKVKSVSYLSNYAEQAIEVPITTLKGTAGKRMVCLANLRPQKDHITLMDAFKNLQARFPDWTLHLVGKDFDDAYSKALKTYIEAKAWQDRVYIYGSCNDVASILEQSTMGVLASKSEGLPLALLEYGLAGLATVCTRVGSCAEVVLDGVHGRVVPSQDAEALEQALALYMESPHLRDAHGTAFKSFVEKNYSKTAIIDKTKTTYNTLCMPNHAK